MNLECYLCGTKIQEKFLPYGEDNRKTISYELTIMLRDEIFCADCDSRIREYTNRFLNDTSIKNEINSMVMQNNNVKKIRISICIEGEKQNE